MAVDTLEKHLSDIIKKIHIGRVVLFLGAGASKPAGGPSELELTNELKTQFPKIDQEIVNLLDVCQDFLEVPGYDRSRLENFITKD
jgi:hypothetical protein